MTREVYGVERADSALEAFANILVKREADMDTDEKLFWDYRLAQLCILTGIAEAIGQQTLLLGNLVATG